MDQLGSKIKDLSEELKHYIETRLEILLLDISEQLTSWVGQSVQKGVGILLLSTGILFSLIALAIYLGDLLDNQSLGFLIVSLPLILLGTIFSITKSKGLANKVQDQFMKGVIKALDEKKTDVDMPEQQKLLPENKSVEKE